MKSLTENKQTNKKKNFNVLLKTSLSWWDCVFLSFLSAERKQLWMNRKNWVPKPTSASHKTHEYPVVLRKSCNPEGWIKSLIWYDLTAKKRQQSSYMFLTCNTSLGMPESGWQTDNTMLTTSSTFHDHKSVFSWQDSFFTATSLFPSLCQTVITSSVHSGIHLTKLPFAEVR